MQSAPAWIRIGGRLPRCLIATLLEAIDADGGLTDWDGKPLTGAGLVDGQFLDVYSLDLIGGVFSALEVFCMDHGLAFVRASIGVSGNFGPERVVFIGTGAPWHFDLLETSEVAITRQKVKALKTIEATMAWFDAADFVPPFLSIVDEDIDAPAPKPPLS